MRTYFKAKNPSKPLLEQGWCGFFMKIIKEDPFEVADEHYETGTKLKIYLFGISEDYYNYMSLLIGQQLLSNGSPFKVTPVPLKGNCVNTKNPNEKVLGFFWLGDASIKDYTIK